MALFPISSWLPAAALGLGLALAAGPAAAAPPTNSGFESGLAGWTTIGSVVGTASTTVTTYDNTVWSILASGTGMAQLDSNGATVASIATTLGLTYAQFNALNISPGTGNLTNGAAIYQTFAGTAGETVSMFFNYVAKDYIPFNDPAFAVLINQDTLAPETITVLASIKGLGINVGTSGNTGWNQFSYVLPSSANYTLAFVTTNNDDTILDSVLFLDNTPGSCVPNCPSTAVATPEPASLSLLGLATIGLLGLRRRRR